MTDEPMTPGQAAFNEYAGNVDGWDRIGPSGHERWDRVAQAAIDAHVKDYVAQAMGQPSAAIAAAPPTSAGATEETCRNHQPSSDEDALTPSRMRRRHVWLDDDSCAACGLSRSGYSGGRTGSLTYTTRSGATRTAAGECPAAPVAVEKKGRET